MSPDVGPPSSDPGLMKGCSQVVSKMCEQSPAGWATALLSACLQSSATAGVFFLLQVFLIEPQSSILIKLALGLKKAASLEVW